jgi:hypothetical protein
MVEHPTAQLEPGDVVMLPDGREARVTGTIGVGSDSQFTPTLEVVVRPTPRPRSAGSLNPDWRRELTVLRVLTAIIALLAVLLVLALLILGSGE